jgi:uncharacterized RDD family membrane protein YckC
VTNDPADHPDASDGPDPDDGPLDPFVDDVDLVDGSDDVGLMRPPSMAARLLSTFIDIFVAYFLVSILDLIVILFFIHPGKKLTDQQKTSEYFAFFAAGILVAIGFVAIEKWGGRTVGRRLLRLRLVDVTGAKPSLGKLALRYGVMFGLALFLSILGVGLVLLGELAAMIQPQRRTAFDMLSRTRVVPEFGTMAKLNED